MEVGAVREFEQKPFYSPTEFAALIEVDPSTVLDWIHREQLYALKLGPKTYRIPLAVVMSKLNPEKAKPKRVAVAASDLDGLEADEVRGHARRRRDVLVAR